MYTDAVLSEYPCHSAILAARSPLLSNLVSRRLEARVPDQPLEIILDDSVVPHRYARVIMKAMYQVCVGVWCEMQNQIGGPHTDDLVLKSLNCFKPLVIVLIVLANVGFKRQSI